VVEVGVVMVLVGLLFFVVSKVSMRCSMVPGVVFFGGVGDVEVSWRVLRWCCFLFLFSIPSNLCFSREMRLPYQSLNSTVTWHLILFC